MTLLAAPSSLNCVFPCKKQGTGKYGVRQKILRTPVRIYVQTTLENDSGVAQSVYRYKANIVIAMIIIMRVVSGLYRPCIVMANIVIANIVQGGLSVLVAALLRTQSF